MSEATPTYPPSPSPTPSTSTAPPPPVDTALTGGDLSEPALAGVALLIAAVVALFLARRRAGRREGSMP